MPCVVVGGVANGLFIPEMDMRAQRVELGRPEYIKPLVSATQQQPEIAKEKDVYNVHPIGLAVTKNQQQVYGIAVVEGMELTAAFEEIMIGFVRDTAEQLAKQKREIINNAH